MEPDAQAPTLMAVIGQGRLFYSAQCAVHKGAAGRYTPASKPAKPRKVRRRTRMAQLPNSRRSSALFRRRGHDLRFGARMDQTALTAAASGRRLAARCRPAFRRPVPIVANGLAVSPTRLRIHSGSIFSATVSRYRPARSCLSLCLWLRPARAASRRRHGRTTDDARRRQR